MKKVWMMVFFLAGYAFALDPMGPPTAGLNQGEWRMGGEYIFSDMEMEISAQGISGTVDGVETHKGYFNIGVGLSDNIELFGRVGGGATDSDLGSIGSGFSGGGGLKVTLFGDESLKWGLLGQCSWIELGESDDISGTLSGLNFAGDLSDTEFVEVQIAFGPTLKLGESLSIYGGPFYHLIDGNTDFDGTLGGFPLTGTLDLDEESSFGGYVGAQLDILPKSGEVTNGAVIFIEGLFASGDWGIGTGLGWRF